VQTKVRYPSAEHKKFEMQTSELVLGQDCACKDILIVDDEYFNQLALTTILGTMKLKADCANNGIQANELYENSLTKLCECEKVYKIIFMDINMPILDGFQSTARILKTAQRYSVVPPLIVAQTAFVDYET
jgi:CheY-like chemotaxis protein